MLKEFIKVDQENVEVLIKRVIKTSYLTTNRDSSVAIGQRDNGDYIVFSLNPNHYFFISGASLSKTLDKTYSILEHHLKIEVEAIEKLSKEGCYFCGRTNHICMNTRECENRTDKICKAALLVAGGGEYTWRRIVASRLLQENKMPDKNTFKLQINNNDMAFVDLANMYLER